MASSRVALLLAVVRPAVTATARFNGEQKPVLFLTRHEWAPPAPHRGPFYADATRTSDSSIKVIDGKLVPLGRSSAVSAFDGVDANQLRELLRKGGGP